MIICVLKNLMPHSYLGKPINRFICPVIWVSRCAATKVSLCSLNFLPFFPNLNPPCCVCERYGPYLFVPFQLSHHFHIRRCSVGVHKSAAIPVPTATLKEVLASPVWGFRFGRIPVGAVVRTSIPRPPPLIRGPVIPVLPARSAVRSLGAAEPCPAGTVLPWGQPIAEVPATPGSGYPTASMAVLALVHRSRAPHALGVSKVAICAAIAAPLLPVATYWVGFGTVRTI